MLGLCCCMASLVVAGGGYSLVAVFRLLIAVTSPLAEHRLMGTPALVVVELGLNSCNSLGSRAWVSSFGAQAYLPQSMWNLPRPGIEPIPPSLAGRFFTTGSPGKSFVYWWPCCMACGVWVPQPGIEPQPWQSEYKDLTIGHQRFLWLHYLYVGVIYVNPKLLIFPSPTFFSFQFTQSCLTLCDPMDCSMSGFPVHHQFMELVQTHVHRVSDAIQPSRPLSSPSLPAFNFSQHQDLFKWVSSLYQVVKILEFQPQHQSFQWIFRTDFL